MKPLTEIKKEGVKITILNDKIKSDDINVIKAKVGEIHTDTFHTSCYLIYFPRKIKEIIIK